MFLGLNKILNFAIVTKQMTMTRRFTFTNYEFHD